MPYKTFQEGDKFNNYKVDEQGKKTGKRLGSFPSKDKANEQIKALYAAENKKEVNTAATTDNVNGITTKGYGENGEWEPDPVKVEIVEPEESKSAATTFAQLMAQFEAEELQQVVCNLNSNFAMLAGNIMESEMVEDKAQALKDLAAEFQGMLETYVKHEATEEMPGDKIEDHMYDTEAGDKELTLFGKFKEWLGLTEKAKMARAGINDLPDSDFLYVESGGKKDEGGKTVPRSLRHLPVHDVAHLRNAIARLSQSDTGSKGGERWLTPALRKSLLAKARKMLESKKELPELAIWKENGQYRWIAAYSNNQRDSDSPAEIITSDSHKEFDQALHNKEWPMPELWLWHIPYPVGETQYHAYDESTGYPVAAGVFKEGCDWAAEGLQTAGWTAISHGMPDKWIRRNNEDSSLIVRHRTKEISFLPQWAAANKNTVSFILKESTMTDEVQKGLPAHKRPEFIAAFGEERVKQIEEALASKAKEAQEQGVETKEKEPTMADVVKALEFLTTELVMLKKQVSEKPVEKEAEEFDLVARLKSLSAVGQETTKVDGRSALAKSGPEETKPEGKADPITGLTVPLVDKIFQSNQAYYNGGAK